MSGYGGDRAGVKDEENLHSRLSEWRCISIPFARLKRAGRRGELIVLATSRAAT